ncbi:MAG: rRNA maturation RNase YbeY [Bdellovibrionales bacterium]|nr:rRNA maturation RNase YbeY [Bdellovibrionales bacterium]
MNLEVVNQTRHPVPKAYLTTFLVRVIKELKRRKQHDLLNEKSDLLVLFVTRNKIRQLNRDFRKKNYATDVLSFDPVEPGSLGELVFCPEVLKKQAKEHGFSYRDELCYMLLHGMLHLIGFEHETNASDAKKMFELQDSIYSKIFPGKI